MGLLNNSNLSGLAQGLLAASGPSTTPVGFGHALAMGMQSRQEQQELQRRQQMDALRMQAVQQQMAEAQRARQAQAALSERFRSGGGRGELAGLLADAGQVGAAVDYMQGPQLSASDLVEVQTPQGPRLVPASQAVGMAPGQEPASAADRYIKAGDGVLFDVQSGAFVRDPTKPDKDPDTAFKQAKDLRGEFIKMTDEFGKQNDAYGRIAASAQDPSAAGDLAMVFNYMKMLDPGSVVRESEYATAANAAGVPDRIRNIYNRVLSGERLAEDQRADFLDRAQRIYREAATGYKKREGNYRTKAQQFNLDPETVIINRQLYDLPPLGQQQPPPPPGFVPVR